FLQAYALYQGGKIKGCASFCADNPLLQHSTLHTDALLAGGDCQAAAHDPGLAKVWEDPWHALALSVALALDGQGDDAATWRTKGLEKLQARTPEWKLAAKFLNAEVPPSIDALSRLFMMPGE